MAFMERSRWASKISEGISEGIGEDRDIRNTKAYLIRPVGENEPG